MQIWRITRSAPGKSRMKARLVSLRCFVCTVLRQESLALSSIWSALFCYAYELLCLWMPQEGIECFHHSPRKLRQNSGDKGKEFTFAAELKFICYISGYKILEKIVYMMSLCGVWWCSNTTYVASAFLKVKKSSSWKTLSQNRKLFTYMSTHTELLDWNEYYDVITKQMNFNCPCHCNQWKYWAKWQWLGDKCGRLRIF